MRPWFSALAIGICVSAMLTGCATQSRLRDIVGDQMTREYGCEDVDVEQAGEERFAARGCGESLAYVVHCEGRQASSCVAIREYQDTP